MSHTVINIAFGMPHAEIPQDYKNRYPNLAFYQMVEEWSAQLDGTPCSILPRGFQYGEEEFSLIVSETHSSSDEESEILCIPTNLLHKKQQWLNQLFQATKTLGITFDGNSCGWTASGEYYE